MRICSRTWAPQVADALDEGEDRRQDAGRRHRRRHRKHDERPGGRVHRQSARRPSARASRAEDLGTVGVAMVEGEPATAPVLVNDRPYPLRVRFPGSARSSLEAMSNTMLVNSSGGTATLGSLTTRRRAARADRNPARKPSAAGRSHGTARRRRHGDRHRGRSESRGGPEAAAVDSRGVRRHVPGAAEVVPRSRRSCWCWRSF